MPRNLPLLPIFPALIAGLAGCAKPPERQPILVNVETYLSTPEHNAATDAYAGRQCLGIGRTARFVATRKYPSGNYDHVYQCI